MIPFAVDSHLSNTIFFTSYMKYVTANKHCFSLMFQSYLAAGFSLVLVIATVLTAASAEEGRG